MSTINKVIFAKDYDSESLVDLERDVQEAMEDLPKDEHGFILGDPQVTVTWIPPEE